MARSPIEMMIDKACGITEPLEPVEMITLRCPECGREKSAEKHFTDLPGTAVVVAHCDKCPCEDNGVYPTYFAADGTQILEG